MDVPGLTYALHSHRFVLLLMLNVLHFVKLNKDMCLNVLYFTVVITSLCLWKAGHQHSAAKATETVCLHISVDINLST